MDVGQVPVDTVDARRIGFLSDTHVQKDDASDLPGEVLDAFRARGVDLIVHCGHYGNPSIFDRLREVAPVLAVKTDLDERLSGERLAREHPQRVAGFTRVIEAGGVRIGVIFDLSGKGFDIKPDGPPIDLHAAPLAGVLREKFGRPVDVVAYANTHIDRVSSYQGVLLVNPGSPNLPGGPRKGGLGTVAVLDVLDGLATVEIIDLRALTR
jgi:putative phosphoesterase